MLVGIVFLVHFICYQADCEELLLDLGGGLFVDVVVWAIVLFWWDRNKLCFQPQIITLILIPLILISRNPLTIHLILKLLNLPKIPFLRQLNLIPTHTNQLITLPNQHIIIIHQIILNTIQSTFTHNFILNLSYTLLVFLDLELEFLD